MRRIAVMTISAVALTGGLARASHAIAPADPPSNVEMLHSLVTQATAEMMREMPAPPANAALQLRAAALHPSNWLIEQAVAEQLARRGIHPRLSAPADSAMSHDTPQVGGQAPAILEYRAVDVALDYVRSRVAMNSGAKFVTRSGRASLSVRLLQPGSGEVLWAHDGTARAQDEVPDELLRGLALPAAPVVTQPTVPVARLTRYTEPLLITLIVGGLISLFYANK